MKFTWIVMLTILTTLFGGTRKLLAQEDYIPIFSQDYSNSLSLEIDPLTFLYSGYSIHLRYQPMFSERLLIGIGTYAMDLPDQIVDISKENREGGWEARIRSAYLIYGELFFNKANHGWFVGEQVGFQNFKVSNDKEVRGSTRFNNLLLMTSLGYSWRPFKGSFYVKPWAGIGYTVKVDGKNEIGAVKYNIAPWFPFITFHAGYTF